MSPRRNGEHRFGNRFIEVSAVVLLAIATVGSAWSAYQASQWNQEQSHWSQASSDERVEASRVFALATQKVSYDSNIVALYAQAVNSDNDTLARFYKESLVRPEFLPVLEEWEASVAEGVVPENLLENQVYMEEQFGAYYDAIDTAEDAAKQADEASTTADAYILSTLIIAVALFFAGVTTSFRLRLVRLALVIGAAMTLIYAASRLVELGVI